MALSPEGARWLRDAEKKVDTAILRTPDGTVVKAYLSSPPRNEGLWDVLVQMYMDTRGWQKVFHNSHQMDGEWLELHPR